ncbi:hypothetical protein [Pseudoxanthomonas broegbernensis]|uniref:hypothetical protein n=1 Tax=Pseudoxanthomonas broegbernensis TaxID=83619 RepID=UPI001391D19E|nr:hypothetical protein [Pseudoxanthomonas broegbernensis]MBB6064969.1 hypothetical protein [Pseudoxanthomonas broegbernensis]
MATRIKKKAAPPPHIRRIDFKQPDETGTIADLIAELNIEQKKENGELISYRTLKSTLEFMEKAIGFTVESKDQPLPMSTLKTIRLLYLTKESTKKQLFRLLAPPDDVGKATMEFITTHTLPRHRDRETYALIDSMSKTLSAGIDPEKWKLFSLMIGQKARQTSTESLQKYVEITNDDVMDILIDVISDDDNALADAYLKLTEVMDTATFDDTFEVITPADEAMFVYVELLAFRHFTLHHRKLLEDTWIKREIGDIRDEANRLCQSIAWNLDPSDQKYSVNEVRELVQEHSKQFVSLVRRATGFDTPYRQHRDNTKRARALLASYGYRSFDESNPDAKILSIYDIVAALCSFRYQQKSGDKYEPRRQGQLQQGKNLQRQFDKGLRPGDPHQAQGVIFTYLNRFYEFRAVFTGAAASHRAWVKYQASRLEAFARCIQLNNIYSMSSCWLDLDSLCRNKAKEIANDYVGRNVIFQLHIL